MAIYSDVRAELLKARKERRSSDIASLSTLIGEMDKKAEGPSKVLNDADAIAVVKKVIAGVEEMISHGNERAADEKLLFEKFLPQQLSDSEVVDLIKEARNNFGYDNLGQIMAYMKSNYAGLYDGRFVSEEAKRQLSQ